MTATWYDSSKREVGCGDKVYSHYNGTDYGDEIAHTLAMFGAGEKSFHRTWLILKHLVDNGLESKVPFVVDGFEGEK